MKIENSNEKKMKNNKYILKNKIQNVFLNKKLSSSPISNKRKSNNLLTCYTEKEKKKIHFYHNYDLNSNNIKLSSSPRSISPTSDYKKYLSGKINLQKQTQNKKYLKINDLIGEDSKKPISKIFNKIQKNKNLGKISNKSYGLIKAYAANTNKGIIRNYNEDRISIMINMNPPNNYINKTKFPKVSYFGVFDGHGGKNCAEYLRDNLLKLICTNKNFPSNINLAIKESFKKADEEFLNKYAIKDGKLIDYSGSCGLFLLIINNMAYIANVGDSRCLISCNNGEIKKAVTRDHKPNLIYEKQRIILNGGIIYQSQNMINDDHGNIFLKGKILIGPYRVLPGKLSVSRTIGDAEAKCKLFGGIPNVVINEPDIYSFNIANNEIDYFILCCDGVFEQLNNEDVFECVSLVVNHNKELLKDNKNKNDINIHSTCGDIVNLILNASMERKSFDNVSCMFVSFKDILNLNKINSNSSKKKSLINSNSSINFIKNSLKDNKKEEISILNNKNFKKESIIKDKNRISPSKYSAKNRTTIDYPNQVKKRIMIYSKNYSNNNIFATNSNKKMKKNLNYSPNGIKRIELFKNNSRLLNKDNKSKYLNNNNLIKYYSFSDNKLNIKKSINNNIIINKIKVIKPININFINNTNNNTTINKYSKSNSKSQSKSKSKKTIIKTENNMTENKDKNILSKNYTSENEKINLIAIHLNKEKKSNKYLTKHNISYNTQKSKLIEKINESPRYLNRNYFKNTSSNSKKSNKVIVDIKLSSINLNSINKSNINSTKNSKAISESYNLKRK